MRGTWIIFRREIGQYLVSPVAYLIAAAFLFLTGFLFNNDLVTSVTVRAASPAVVPAFLSFALVFFAPVLTMRMLAEERREGTLELLLTAPVRDSDIVVGKFLGAWFYYSLLLALTLVYQVILVAITQPDLGHAISAYIGIWLYGGATLAVGLFFSAITENQIVAAFLSTAALLVLYLGGLAGQIVANVELARVINQLTLQGHFVSSFAYGLVRAEDVAYYAGLIVIMLHITMRVVESHRWRA
ncbi:MAG TPA: ABC transporter permease [Spirillospora sp.]|nr:ABC transporter permease [Spirillospora sp.]